MSRLLSTIVLAWVLTTLGAGVAQASPSQAMIFDAQRELLDPSTRDAAMTELESLGVRHVRVLLTWKDVAPTPEATSTPGGDLSDPAAGYDWSRYDGAMEALKARGWDVLMTVTLPGPKWAMSGKKDFLTRPSPTQFGRFVTAASRRYGEQVGQWAVLNEPNHPDFLLPQYDSKKRPKSPGIYRKLFQAADRALRSTGNGDDTLLIGETAPRGTGKVVAPLTFLRGTLCLNSKYRKRSSCGRLNADGWAHHAYTTKAGPFFEPPGKNDVTIGVLSRLNSAIAKAERARAMPRNTPIYLTEFGIQSTPDRVLGVSLAKQPIYRAISERLAYSNKRVKAFSQYLLRDDLPREGVPTSQRYGGFDSGLRFSTGGAKPSLLGFKLTLAAFRDGRSRTSLWGLVRGAGKTSVTVQYQDKGGRGFKRLKTVRTNARGYFTLRTSYRGGRRYRLSHDGQNGPATGSYTRP